jgi:integrase
MNCRQAGWHVRSSPPPKVITAHWKPPTGCMCNRAGVLSVWLTLTCLALRRGLPAMVRKGSGATTVIRAQGVLSGILTDAVKGKRLAANPVKGLDNLPRKSGKRRVYLSADDVTRLANKSGEHRVLVLVLAYCGLRWGEAIGLRVRDVQFLRRRISVSENAVQIGSRHVVGPTKGREDRSVPVPEFVLNELSVQCKGKAPDALVFNGRSVVRV